MLDPIRRGLVRVAAGHATLLYLLRTCAAPARWPRLLESQIYSVAGELPEVENLRRLLHSPRPDINPDNPNKA